MLKLIFFYTFMIIGTINLVHFGMYLIGANVYDIRQIRRNHRRSKRRAHRQVPLVTVLIPAHNEEVDVLRCLESVRRSSYRKLQIIVVNDASTDATPELVRGYIAKHPKANITMLTKRTNVGKAKALNTALRRKAKGELVMTLDADSVLDSQAIRRAVHYFENPKIVGVAANVRIMDQSSVLGIVQKFEHLLGYRSKKMYSLANCEFIIGGVASTYRRSAMQSVGYYSTDTATEDIGLSIKLAAKGNRDYRLMYAADVVAQTEGVQTFSALLKQRYRWKMGNLQNLIKYSGLAFKRDSSFSRSLTWYRVPMAFLSELIVMIESVLLIGMVVLSITHRTPALFFGAYLFITMYVLLAIWPDEHASITRKLGMSLQAPALYFMFYIMNVVQIVSIIRCLLKPGQLMRRGNNEASNWTSPARRGRRVQFS